MGEISNRSFFIPGAAIVNLHPAVIGVIMMFIGGPWPAFAGEVTQLQGSWWTGPAMRSRHSSFVATFDSPTSNDADYAWGNPRAGGGAMNPDVPGKYKGATRIEFTGGHLHFLANSNFNPDVGTIRMLVKGEVWRDETPRWLFEARAGIRLGIRRDRKALSLILNEIRRFEAPVPLKAYDPVAQLDLPLEEVSTNEWHCVAASWDRSKELGWIALDGRCFRGPMKFPNPTEPSLVFYVGGGYESRRRGQNEPGLEFDELVIYDQSIPSLETEPRPLPPEDGELLPKVEEAARKCLNYIAGLQRGGGWTRCYTWPTLMGDETSAREYVQPEGSICTEGAGTADIAAQFLYSAQVLGDYRYREVATRAADFYLGVQDPWGSWRSSYYISGSGVKPVEDERYIKLDDNVQRQSLFFLAYLYRLTGETRYLAAIKRAGEFMLLAQNPNGSWSHHWDAVSRVGRTEETGGNKPSGGQLNDATINDAIDSMILLYHLTGEQRYVEAIKRVGQWLIDAQIKGPARGWADQYDQDNNPIWAREFEPPSCSSRATRLACEALVEIYRLSKDERFLRPIRECLAWMEKAFPDGKMYLFHDLQTGRPIAAWEFKIVYLDDPEQLAWYKTKPRGGGYSNAFSITPSIKSLLENAAASTKKIPPVTVETATRVLSELRAKVRASLATQNEAGIWANTKWTAPVGHTAGTMFSALLPLDLLRYIEAARMVMGELPLVWRGDGQLIQMAYLKDDWYDIPWKPADH